MENKKLDKEELLNELKKKYEKKAKQKTRWTKVIKIGSRVLFFLVELEIIKLNPSILISFLNGVIIGLISGAATACLNRKLHNTSLKLKNEIYALSNELMEERKLIKDEEEITIELEDVMPSNNLIKNYKDEEDIKEYFYEDKDDVKKDDNKFIKKRK